MPAIDRYLGAIDGNHCYRPNSRPLVTLLNGWPYDTWEAPREFAQAVIDADKFS